ncbi:MAG: hypothetical protein LBD80_07690 [Tannerella sp.]|jgi:hypothetical protein|nr:hypothetical protein [Tannerella sp.]
MKTKQSPAHDKKRSTVHSAIAQSLYLGEVSASECRGEMLPTDFRGVQIDSPGSATGGQGAIYAQPSAMEWDYDIPAVRQPAQTLSPMTVSHYPSSSSGIIVRQTTETDNELQRMIASNRHIDEKTKELLFRNQSLIQRLFPSQKDKLIAEMQGKAVQSALDFRLNLYRLSTEFHIEAVREHFNALLLTIRGDYRQRVSEFMLTKLTELHKIVDEKQRFVIELASGKIQYAEKLPAMLQGRYLASIDKEFEGFIVFAQKQIQHFESIIDEQIKRLN